MAALQKMERNLEWNGGRFREREGCDWYKCGWLHELSLCSLGDASASERAPRMASAHWLSSEGSGKSGSGNKTVTFPGTTSAQASQSLRISGSQCGDTWQHGRGQLRLAQCVLSPPMTVQLTLHNQYCSLLVVGTALSSRKVLFTLY